MDNEYVSVSFIYNSGHCVVCGYDFKEGWLDEQSNEVCDDCKRESEEPSDNDVLELLSGLPFVEFEIRQRFVEGE